MIWELPCFYVALLRTFWLGTSCTVLYGTIRWYCTVCKIKIWFFSLAVLFVWFQSKHTSCSLLYYNITAIIYIYNNDMVQFDNVTVWYPQYNGKKRLYEWSSSNNSRYFSTSKSNNSIKIQQEEPGFRRLPIIFRAGTNFYSAFFFTWHFIWQLGILFGN